MNANPKVCVLTGYGINCDMETQHAFNIAGARAERVHLNELISKKSKLEDYQIFFIPGGFSYGDELGAGKVLANKILELKEELIDFIKQGYLIGGHCNGAQALVKSGLLPGDKGLGVQTATFTANDSASYECRWVYVKHPSRKCIWTKDLPVMKVAVAHGEGKFYSSDENLIKKLEENNQISAVYTEADGTPTNKYPFSPNGSLIAGICNESGNAYCQMPHPERDLALMNQPQWTRLLRKELRQGKSIDEINWQGLGLQLFKNPVNYAVKKLI